MHVFDVKSSFRFRIIRVEADSVVGTFIHASPERLSR